MQARIPEGSPPGGESRSPTTTAPERGASQGTRLSLRTVRSRIVTSLVRDGHATSTADLDRLLVRLGWTWIATRTAVADALIGGPLTADERGRIAGVA